jgi:hypothetical protein
MQRMNMDRSVRDVALTVLSDLLLAGIPTSGAAGYEAAGSDCGRRSSREALLRSPTN